MPEHYCRQCISVVYVEDKHCLECGEQMPGDGWSPLSKSMDPWLGKKLDDTYLVTNRIGRGASAIVYRVESLKIGRRFAVKLLDLARVGEQEDAELLRARLDREVDAIGQLRNPHTVHFYDVIEPVEGWVGIVMDYIEGETLEQLVKREGRLDVERALRILRQVSNGLHEAHEAGLIHRDIKPDNIMVETLPAGDDFAHLVDFGIVWADDGVHVTKGFVGTPLYASPEQAIGGRLDRRSDIYSLGAILFFMLTGRPPFESQNVLEVLSRHVKEAPPPLASLLTDNPPPEAVRVLVESMLAKSPERRPSSLADVIPRIDAIVELPVSSRGEEEYREYGQALVEESASSRTHNGLIFSGNIIETDPDAEDTDGDEVDYASPDDSGVFEVADDSGVFARTLTETSDSFVESLERDDTGPKAAIFRLRSTGVHRLTVRNESNEKSPDSADNTFGASIGKLRVPLRRGTIWASGSQHRFAFWEGSDDVILLKMTPRSQLEIPIGPDDEISSLGLTHKQLLLGYRTGEVASVNLDSGAGEVLFEDVRRMPMSAVASDERGFIYLAGSSTGRLYMLRTFRSNRDWVCIQTGDPITALSVSPNGDIFGVVRGKRTLEVYDSSGAKRRLSSTTFDNDVIDVCFSNDSHLVAVAEDNGQVVLQQTLGGKRLIGLEDVDGDLRGVYFNHEDDLLAVCGEA